MSWIMTDSFYFYQITLSGERTLDQSHQCDSDGYLVWQYQNHQYSLDLPQVPAGDGYLAWQFQKNNSKGNKTVAVIYNGKYAELH